MLCRDNGNVILAGLLADAEKKRRRPEEKEEQTLKKVKVVTLL
jgi:hypothetical protein